MEDLTNFDVKTEADKMLLAMRFLADVEIGKISETVERAHTIAPFLDPTAYRDALQRGDMDDIRRLADALKEPVRIFKEIAERHGVPA